MTSEPVWMDPAPTAAHGNGIWMARLGPLVDHPKRWALIGEFNQTTAAQMTARGGSMYKVPPGKWEYTSRRHVEGQPELPAGRSYLFARYMGPGPDAEQA